MTLVGLVGLIPIAIGLGCLLFPRTIQRWRLDALKHDPLGEFFRPGIEGEHIVIFIQVMGVVLVLLGMVIMVYAK
jgi:hypothetical protein